MKLFLRIIPQIIIVLILCIAAVVCLISKDEKSASSAYQTSKTIVIDAGHGRMTKTISF